MLFLVSYYRNADFSKQLWRLLFSEVFEETHSLLGGEGK